VILEDTEPRLEDRLEQCLDRALQHCLSGQDARGAWHVEPDPRLFDTGLVAYVLSRIDRPDAQVAAARARPWLEGFRPQEHDPYARLFDETPRRLLRAEGGPIDLRDPVLYSNLLRRKALLLYVLGLHAGAPVLSPYTRAQVKEQVRQFYLRSGTITMKRWSKADLISIYAILEFLDGNIGPAATACQHLARMQADDGSYFHNPVSTAIAFLALSCGAPGSPTWQSCLEYLLASQREDGTWRFCTSDNWDTSLTLRTFGEHPRFSDASAKAVEFLIGAQNPDGGWGFRTDVESDNDTSSCVLLALRGHDGDEIAMAIERGVAYLLGRQRKDGLWNTWQSSDDHPVEDCIAHITGALAAFRGSYTRSIRLAQRWLEQQYESNGRWRAGWYRNLPYSTLEASKGLKAGHPLAYAAVRGLRGIQNPDGGFPLEPGQESSASATGLAVAALAEHHDIHQPFLRRALDYLFDTQEADGSWRGKPELFGPRPLMYHLPTNTHAFVGLGLMTAWRRVAGSTP
jgi:squalene-hopene/tetraprenyl-beta-curcumene cyclase